MVVSVGELPVEALQVPSPQEGAGTPKKARATLRGITARRLAAHRRLIAAISGVDGAILFSDAVGRPVAGALIASSAVDDVLVDPVDIAPGR